MTEYKLLKYIIKEGKSCGMDEIRPKVLKRCNLDATILQFCNRGFINKQKLKQWSLLNIIPIPKSRDLSLAGNYRGIRLISGENL